MQKNKSGWGLVWGEGLVEGRVWGMGSGIGVGGLGDVNQALKVLLKEHKGIVQY